MITTAIIIAAMLQPVIIAICYVPYSLQKESLHRSNYANRLVFKDAVFVAFSTPTIGIRGAYKRGVLSSEMLSHTTLAQVGDVDQWQLKASRSPTWSKASSYLVEPTYEDAFAYEVALGIPFRCVIAEHIESGPNFKLAPIPGMSISDYVDGMPFYNYTGFEKHWRFLWWRVAANTIFWACVLLLLRLYMPRAIRFLWRLRTFLRIRRGQCPSCGYPVPGLAMCPECGTRVDAKKLL